MSKLVCLRSSDGVDFEFGQDTLLDNVPYFSDMIISTPSLPEFPKNSENAPRLVIDLPEKSTTLRPLFSRFISPNTAPDFKTLDLDTSFDALRAACKYEIRELEEEIRDAIRKNVMANLDQRDHGMNLAILSADQDMILYMSGVLREHGSNRMSAQVILPDPPEQMEETARGFPKLTDPPPFEYQGEPNGQPVQTSPFPTPQVYPPVISANGFVQNNVTQIQQPVSLYPHSLTPHVVTVTSEPSSSRQTLVAGSPSLPPSPNPSTLTASNISEPSRLERRNAELARIKALATAVDAAKARNAPQHEINALMREEAAATAAYCQETRAEMEAIQNRIQTMVSDVPPTLQDPPPGYEQSQLERAAALARTSSYLMSPSLKWQKDCDYINSLTEQLELLRMQNAPQEVIDRQEAAVNNAARTLIRKLEQEEEQEEAMLREMERNRQTLDAIMRSNDPKEIQRLVQELESGTRKRQKKRTCTTALACSSIFFMLALGGMATELALAILISKGTQGTEANLDRSLTVKVTCDALSENISGVCDPPSHWSLAFGYVAPLIAIQTILWTLCCDRKGRYKFTSLAWGVTIITTVAAVVGSTMLASQGYGSADCSKCLKKAVYVPLRKLRDMNRGQAAGAWFAMLGWFFSVAFLYAD